MAFEVEWLKGAKDELDAELAYVLNEFGIKFMSRIHDPIHGHSC